MKDWHDARGHYHDWQKEFVQSVVDQLYCVRHGRETEMHDGQWLCPVCYAAVTNTSPSPATG